MGLLENPFFRKRGGGGHTKKQYVAVGGNCLKREAWTVCRFKGGGLAKESNAPYVDY